MGSHTLCQIKQKLEIICSLLDNSYTLIRPSLEEIRDTLKNNCTVNESVPNYHLIKSNRRLTNDHSRLIDDCFLG